MEITNDLLILFTGLCETLNKSRFDYCVAGGFAVESRHSACPFFCLTDYFTDFIFQFSLKKT